MKSHAGKAAAQTNTFLGAILEAKIDQKTKKNEIKNKSDFKTHVTERVESALGRLVYVAPD